MPPPQVLSITPSRHFLGNDGSWSTFAIYAGTPVTTLLVLPAINGESTWIVDALACEDPGESSCSNARGQTFNPALSSTWKNLSSPSGSFKGLNFGPQQPLNSLLQAPLQYNASCLVGTDVLTLRTDGDLDPTLQQQFIATYTSPIPYIGIIGLSAYNDSVLSFSDGRYSVLGALNSSGQVGSAYWGYTAGAYYRTDDVRNLGGLSFGGFDATLGNVDNVVTVPFNLIDTRGFLVVSVREIQLADSDSSKAQSVPMQKPVMTLIDSVVPEIWLPEYICNVFEDYFGLVWNDTVQMYLVNDTLNNDLMQRNPSVTFVIAADDNSLSSTSITLPYAALQPFAGFPFLYEIYGDNTDPSMRYFPLKRAQTSNQFYLGRTFLQHAYVAANYDRRQFNVSPALFPSATTDEDLRMVVTTGISDVHHNKLSTGTIAGIAVAAIAALSILTAIAWWFCFHRTKQSRVGKSEDASTLGGTTIEAWNDEVSAVQVEHYKPELVPMLELNGEEQDKFKPELDATETALGTQNRGELYAGAVRPPGDRSPGPASPTHRHELSVGSVRRSSGQSRASVSPLDDRARRRQTGSDSYGMPSPQTAILSSPQTAIFSSPPFGSFGTPSPHLSDTSGQPSPPVSESANWIGGPIIYELHGRSRDNPASPMTPVPGQHDDSAMEERRID